jgi:hypothetical protein
VYVYSGEAMERPTFPAAILEFFRATGSRGGTTRAEKYTKRQLSEWGKKGGRPRKKLRPQKENSDVRV